MKCKMSFIGTDGKCNCIKTSISYAVGQVFINCDGLPEDIAQCPFWCARSRSEGNHIKGSNHGT